MKNTRLASAILLVSALALAGCTDATFEDIAPKAEKQLPPKLVESMRAKGMSRTSPIMVRIFKEEGKLEVWKQKDTGRFDLAAAYDICKWSGKLGPKFTEGDRQAPEGFYPIRPHQMNPNSSYHLAFNMGFPNNFDRALGRSGQHLMVHGACSSAGCYSMTDEQMEQIYAFARDAFRGGQPEFQVQAFPFRMTAANMARYKSDPNIEFWKMLKEGYDHFEITKVPPKVDVCGKRYVFNQILDANARMTAGAACPVMTQPESLQTAYRSYQASFEKTFAALEQSAAQKTAPAPTIAGFKEASLVADWSRRRSRGERVSREPPSLQPAAPAQVAAVPAERPQPVAAATAASAQAALSEASRPAATAAAPVTPVAQQATDGTPVPQASSEVVSTGNDQNGDGKRRRFWNLFER